MSFKGRCREQCREGTRVIDSMIDNLQPSAACIWKKGFIDVWLVYRYSTSWLIPTTAIRAVTAPADIYI